MRLLVATQNKGKVEEYNRLLDGLGWEIVGLGDIGLEALDVEETGETFEENALIKARVYAEASDMITLSDDSGIVVDALNGAPGIYSARYGGPELTDGGRRQLLIGNLSGVPQEERTARFVCIIAVVDPRDGTEYTVDGTVEGHVIDGERGEHGFGYDPLFVPEGYDLTFGEMLPDVKDPLSHRGVAAQKLPDILQKLK